MEDQDHIPSPTIQALGIVQNGPPNRRKATGDVDGIGSGWTREDAPS
jgi:hypothetical protein